MRTNVTIIDTGGSERFKIDSTGDATFDSTGNGLVVKRTGNSAYVQIYPAYSSIPTIMGKGAGGLHLGYNSNTAGIRIDTNNNVGINKTPAGYGDTKLEVNGNVSGTRFLSGGTITNGTHAFEAYGSSFESSSIRLKEQGSGENEDPGILFQKGNAASTGDHCGGIYFQGTSSLNYAIIRGTCAGSSKGQLNIHIAGQQNTITRTSNDTPVFQLGEGGLALGATPNDSYKLYVNGASYFANTLTVGTGNSIQLVTSGGTTRGFIQATDTDNAHLIIATSNAEDICFRDGGLSGTTNMTILGNGDIKLNGYGSGSRTGTVAKYLAVKSDGGIIETDGTGSGSGSGTVSSSTTTSSTTDGEVAIYTASTTVKQAAKLYYNGSDDSLTVGQTSSNGTAQFNVIGDGYFSTRIGVGSSPNSSYSAFFSGNIYSNGDIGGYSKSFRIPHPTKEGMNLRHSSLEGPEIGVYQRGEIQGDTIELPDYWVGLVRDGTVTVQLTPKGSFQQLYVVSASNTEVRIAEANGADIDCYYTIYGERADVDRYDVEYEGEI